MNAPSPPELSADSRVLVTGASGLIGRCVAALLRGRVELFCVSRVERRPNGECTWLAADLAEPGTARRLVEHVEPSIVIHLAGAVRGDRSLDAVLPTLGANLLSTVELLEAATRAGVARIVASGSLLEEPSTGDPSATPPSPYGASRWASSMYARLFHTLFETPVTILRPSYAYGPGQETTKLLPHVISTALRGDRPQLASGERLVDFVYAEDVGRAYVTAATAPDVEGVTIDIGCGEATPVRDVVDALVDLMGPETPRPVYGALHDRPFEQEIRVATERAARLLGWTATTALDEGLRRTLAWYVGEAARAGRSHADR
jgi:nucleoside-diphosphate-sugar epimerase